MRIRTKFGSLGLIAVVTFLLCVSFVSTTSAESEKLTVRVMTRNMDAGTDFIYFMDDMSLEDALYATIQEVIESKIPERAALLAHEIAMNKPDLVALQEVTTWKFASESGTIELNQLNWLMTALEQEDGAPHYRVAVVQQLAEIPVPGVASFADYDAILVRTDLPPGQLDVIGTETHMYNDIQYFPLPDFDPIPLFRGWIGADIKIRGARFKFANTHLESFNYPDAYPQLNQAEQLVADLQDTSLPIILAGDFNSAAPPAQYPPDATPSYAYIANHGFIDAWSSLRPKADYGFTWPLFWEDSIPGPTGPIERIDLIFSMGPKALWIKNTGFDSLDGLYASDHLGVVADFKLENHPPAPKKK
jgi:endonuclease/exonuclease/phosphatase family metal-dependent hydrolase